MNALQTWLGTNLDFPALVLVAIFMLGVWVMWRTQANPDNKFDFSDMLRDESGKPSAFRLGIFVSLAVSSWGFMYMMINTHGKMDPWIYLGYIAIWSGAKIAEKLVDAYRGVKPDTGEK